MTNVDCRLALVWLGRSGPRLVRPYSGGRRSQSEPIAVAPLSVWTVGWIDDRILTFFVGGAITLSAYTGAAAAFFLVLLEIEPIRRVTDDG